MPTVSAAPESLSYTALPESLPPLESKEFTPNTVGSPKTEVPQFNVSDFIIFSPSPEPEVSAPYLAVNNSKEMLIDNAIIPTYDDSPARPDMDWLSLHKEEGRDAEDDHPYPPVQHPSQDPSRDEIVVDMLPLHRRTSSPKS